MTTPRNRPLGADELVRFGNELDALRERVVATIGQTDADYIRRIHASVRYTGIAGRMLIGVGAITGGLLGAVLHPAALAMLVRRHAAARAVEDPRKHGTGPQRHPRPVRLDAGPALRRPQRTNGTSPAPPTTGARPTTGATTPGPTCAAWTTTSATACCASSPSSAGNPSTSRSRWWRWSSRCCSSGASRSRTCAWAAGSPAR